MKRYLIIVLIIFLFTVPVEAQCAMCRAVLESEQGNNTAQGINNGIIYLMAIPKGDHASDKLTLEEIESAKKIANEIRHKTNLGLGQSVNIFYLIYYFSAFSKKKEFVF